MVSRVVGGVADGIVDGVVDGSVDGVQARETSPMRVSRVEEAAEGRRGVVRFVHRNARLVNAFTFGARVHEPVQ